MPWMLLGRARITLGLSDSFDSLSGLIVQCDDDALGSAEPVGALVLRHLPEKFGTVKVHAGNKFLLVVGQRCRRDPMGWIVTLKGIGLSYLFAAQVEPLDVVRADVDARPPLLLVDVFDDTLGRD